MKLTLFPFVKEFIYEAYIVDNFCLNFIKAFEQEFYEDGGMLIRLVVSLFFFSRPYTRFSPVHHTYWKGITEKRAEESAF